MTLPEKERKRLVDLSRSYWKVPETVLLDVFKTSKRGVDAYRQWLDAPSTSKDAIAAHVGLTSQFFKQVSSVSARAKTQLREENQVIDAYLVRYKGYTPTHKANKEQQTLQMLQTWGVGMEEIIPGLELYIPIDP